MSHTSLLPPPLRVGDTIGVVSLSSPIAAFCPRRLERGCLDLKRRGFHLRFGRHVAGVDGLYAGSPEARLEDLHTMFRDPEVRAIITTIGGSGCHQLLPGLDFDLVRGNPKLLIGYSDSTAVQAAIWQMTGLTVISGPAVLPQFGEFGGCHEYTWQSFERVTGGAHGRVQLEPSRAFTTEFLAWDQEDNRPRATQLNPGPMVWRCGEAEGPLVAPNAGTLMQLAGTPYWPSLDGAVLCLEFSEESNAQRLDTVLVQLQQLGAFERLRGLLFGRLPANLAGARASFMARLGRVLAGTDFPVVLDIDHGHTDPMLSLPWGVTMRVAAREGNDCSLELMDLAVSSRGASATSPTQANS